MNKLNNFKEKRTVIFKELVKGFWNGDINSSEDLEKLALDLQSKLNFNESDLPFIKNHIRLSLGLDIRENSDFTDEYELVKSMDKITLPIISKLDYACEYCEDTSKCEDICKYDAHIYSLSNKNLNNCITCGECETVCDYGGVASKSEFIPLIEMLKDKDVKVFASVAPAIIAQFGDNVEMGQLRTALKIMGFDDLVEVALFADILTIREALEFNHLVENDRDVFLTSCCCPIWFNLTKRSYPEIFDKMSPSVSPMIASGKVLKKLYPNSKVVFIAPCVAKKSEAKEEEFDGIIDFVINFQELKDIFEVLDIDVTSLNSEDKDQASLGGRLYAKKGGVTFSIKSIVNRLEPKRVIDLKAKKVDGVKNCKELLEKLSQGEDIEANFVEGMGCIGGCVGGPKTIVDKDKATIRVNEFGENSVIMTPFDNYNVMKILSQIGVENISDLINNKDVNDVFTRNK